MTKRPRFSRFDPARVARLEMANYVAYYRRQWFRLLRVSITLVREAFGLNGFDGLRAASSPPRSVGRRAFGSSILTLLI